MPLNLCLHCGAHEADRNQIRAAVTPEPTETWQPIPHARLLDQVEHTLGDAGLNVVSEAHALGRDGDRYFGMLEVRNGRVQEDYALVVGLRNSHDQSYPAGLVIGSGVFVCDNLAFSGEIKFARKHTRFIDRDLPQLVQAAVGRLGEMRHKQDERIEAYKSKRLADRDAHHLMVRMVDTGTLPVTRLPVALREFREPSHEQFLSDGRRTAWTLMNATTEALKGRNLDALPRRTQAMHGLLDRACHLN
ncbi:MAG: DUF932 domain-containing protein [Phycisphaeraceae bacterium]